jgi:hypothetical protein
MFQCQYAPLQKVQFSAFWGLSECILVIFSNHLTPIYTGMHIQNKFWGWSYVLGPTFVVFLFGKKSQDGDSIPRI